MKTVLGVALGGGAGRGVAHVGVIKCFDAAGIRPDLIVGTSIGALIGSVWACGWDYERIHAWASEVVQSDELRDLGLEVFAEPKKDPSLRKLSVSLKERLVFARMLLRPFITQRETLRKLVDRFVPDVRIEDLPRPYACTTLDIVRGGVQLIDRGALRDAVMRSISIAGIFPPFEEDTAVLLDAGPVCNVPVDACRERGARVVVAVNLHGVLSKYLGARTALATMLRADEVARFKLNRQEALRADVVVEPRVESLHWADFKQLDLGIELGEAAARDRLPELRYRLTPKPLRPFRRLAGWARRARRREAPSPVPTRKRAPVAD